MSGWQFSEAWAVTAPLLILAMAGLVILALADLRTQDPVRWHRFGWMLMVLLLPVLGSLAYLSFGSRRPWALTIVPPVLFGAALYTSVMFLLDRSVSCAELPSTARAARVFGCAQSAPSLWLPSLGAGAIGLVAFLVLHLMRSRAHEEPVTG